VNAGRVIAKLALEADERSEHHGDDEADEVFGVEFL
jgi:hypothetical protein